MAQVNLGQEALAPWLEQGVTISEDGTVIMPVTPVVSPDDWAVDHIRRGDNGGYASSTLIVKDTVRTWTVTFLPDFVTINIAEPGGSANRIYAPLFTDDPHHVRFQVSTDGADLDWAVYVDGVIASSGGTSVGLAPNGSPIEVALSYAPGTAGSQLTFGHVAVYTSNSGIPILADTVEAAFGHQEESAGRRIERLCNENDITFSAVGSLDDTSAMGPQGPRTLVQLITEAAETDLGLLYENRGFLGFTYRTRTNLYNQAVILGLDYPLGVFSLLPEPIDDDQQTRNDVTAKRTDGGESRALLEVGALSVLDPPDGVGRYDTSVTVNVAGDGFLSGVANWLMRLGTVDEARYPKLAMQLHNPTFFNDPDLTADVIGMDAGDRVFITNLPSWLPPEDVSLLALGFKETLHNFTWDIEFNCVPESPYDIAVYGDTVGGGPDRYDTPGSALLIGIDSTDTAFDVFNTLFPTSSEDHWTTNDNEFPFDIMVGGERMTVTDIAATFFNAQTFTVVRSVNGVVKSHDANTDVRLFKTPRYGL